MKQTRILVVDDEPSMREVLQIRLQEWGFEVKTAGDGREAKKLAESYSPDLVISDVVMPEISGLDLLSGLKGDDPQRPVILITAHATVDIAVEAMKVGAQDFLTKPLDYPKLKAILDVAQVEIGLRQDSRALDRRLERGAGLGPIVGTSRPMREVYKLIEAVAKRDASILLTGESGTGKEMVARIIHEKSSRSTAPFIAINAAAIPHDLMESEVFGHEKGAFTGATDRHQGCFEMADQGILFLDEIAEMSIALQAKLLRVLEDGRVRRLGGKAEMSFNVRVMAATNLELSQAVSQGKLRQDLYYRLNVVTIHLPALRERKSDIPLLAQCFLSKFNHKHNAQIEGVRDDALELLSSYAWPGNVRELRNVIERAVVLAEKKWIDVAHLPPYIQSGGGESADVVLPLGITAAEAEKKLILKTLELTGDNKAEAARRLGLDVKTIRNKLKSYGLN